MNKKLLAVMGISGTLMLGSVYSISANTSGYELYKSALKQTHMVNSASMNINLNVLDNKTSIFSADSLFMSDSVNQVNSLTTQLQNESETSNMKMVKQDGNWLVMKDGVETVYKMKASSYPHHKNSSELKDDFENLIDVITKNLQKQITVTEKQNGKQLIDLDLSGKEIPLSANAFTTLMIKHAVMIQDNNDQDTFDFHIIPTFPELESDISVKQLKFSALVNKANYIENQIVKVVVTGKDPQGKSHELMLSINMKASDFNDTIVLPIKIPSEKVVEFNHGHSEK